MKIDIKVPDVGEGVTQVTLTEWRKSIGDPVEKGEIIVEIMTDKAAFDVESHEAGILCETLVEPDEEISVDTILGRIETTD